MVYCIDYIRSVVTITHSDYQLSVDCYQLSGDDNLAERRTIFYDLIPIALSTEKIQRSDNVF